MNVGLVVDDDSAVRGPGLGEAVQCRRQVLLSYFGEDSDPCGNCDHCQEPPEVFDGRVSVQKALSAVLRTGEYFGVGYLVDVLTGNSTDRVLSNGHDRLPTFGVGRDQTRQDWQTTFRQMLGRDLLRPDPERRGGLRLTENARPYLKGEVELTLLKHAKPEKQHKKIRALVAEDDAPLLAALKALRRGLAEEAKVPAYIIFNDRTLIEMAEQRPANLDEMARINGVGAKKLEKYGAAFVACITGDQPENLHPARRKLAGGDGGDIFDRLMEAQMALHRGPDGTGKPMRCSQKDLAKVAKAKPKTMSELTKLLGDKYSERFGPAFLDAIAEH